MYPLSKQAEEVAQSAGDIVEHYYHNTIETEHLFLALIKQPNGITTEILSNLGVDIESLTERLDIILRASPKVNIFGNGNGPIFLSPRVKRVIDLAVNEVTRLHDDNVSSEHIFLSIFNEKNSPIIRVFESFKITHEQVDKQIQIIRQQIKPRTKVSEAASNRPQSLQVFLCHSSEDKPRVRQLYQQLIKDGISPWLDEEDLLPGYDWQLEIPKAVQNSDVVLVCLSKDSVTKTGYVQKEIKQALDVADEQPEGSIFIIPLKLEECDVPKRLSRWQWVNLYSENGYQRLLRSLNIRADEKKRLQSTNRA